MSARASNSADLATAAAISSLDEWDEVEPKALRALTRHGESGVHALLRRIRSAGEGPSAQLAVLRAWNRDNVTSQLATLATDEDFLVAGAALGALGRIGSRSAVAKLIDILKNNALAFQSRATAADALGAARSKVAIDPLRSAVSSANRAAQEDTDACTLVFSAVRALAQLGSHRSAELVADWATAEDEFIRTAALTTLSHTVGPSTFRTLCTSMSDTYYEVRIAAIDALFYLGTRHAIDELIQYVDDTDDAIRARARSRLQDLTADEFEDPELTLTECTTWWGEHRSEYRGSICHRSGQPVDPTIIASDLSRSRRAFDIRREFEVVTGWRPAYSATLPELRKKMRAWLRRTNIVFEAGELYKYGRRLDQPDGA